MPAVGERLAALRSPFAASGIDRCLAVKDLVVVCSSSRGGSSMFSELLRRSPDLLTFSAEINPHVVIAGLGSNAADLDVLRAELGNDLGQPARRVVAADLARHTAWRLTMQWPAEVIDPGRVAEWVHGVLEVLGARTVPFDRAAFVLELLARVRESHPVVNPYRYDLPDAVVAARFPEVAVPAGPPAEPVVEMTPFVLPRPWRVATSTQAAATTVVTTTPRNAFRLPLLADTFPNARLRVVHLTRNPAAAVNGLRDGWLHRGFFFGPCDQPLAISGYSDAFPKWGTRWWNYDRPPQWREWTGQDLVSVCGFQWRAAHEATIEGASRIRADVHRVAVEHIARPGHQRDAAITSLCRWLDIDPHPILRQGPPPVVMPTVAPRPRRWIANTELLAPVLGDPSVVGMARELGYPADPCAWE